MTEKKLTGKVALVTGGARGLGRGYALRLARLGANVAIIDRNLNAASVYAFERDAMTAPTVMAECEAMGVAALGIEADVSDRARTTAAVAAVLHRFGRLDIAVCNAGGGYHPYGTAKAAIIHYTRALAQELGAFNITVNAIAPGIIRTGRLGDRAHLSGRIALRREGTIEDCAKVVEFLATDLSDYVTGRTILIDGGLLR